MRAQQAIDVYSFIINLLFIDYYDNIVTKKVPKILLFSGLKVPEDVSVCGFTNGQRAIACDPMLTTVEQRGRKVGEEAADILINKVEGLIPKDKIERRIVKTRLVVRGSTRERI